MISSIPQPLIVHGIRRCNIPNLVTTKLATNTNSVALTRYLEYVTRWKKNLSRLYARRILDIMAASAAATIYKSKLEASMIDKPSQWQNWEAKDWEETAVQSLGQSKLSRFYMAAKRVVHLSLLTSPMMILMPMSYVYPPAKDAAWRYALWGIEHAGPTWIKLVQWATTRQDLFSQEFCNYFGRLRDNTEGHSWKETQQILQRELGDAASAIEIDPKCIGSGCIAQVYRGTLTKATSQYPAGTAVAIKVQHPNIWDKVCMDFYVLLKFAKWLEAIPKLNLEYLSLRDTVRQFRDIMLPQLDLTLEAGHLKRFNRDFASDDQVFFPQPMDDLTTTQVLVETFIEGKPIIEYTKEGVATYDEKKQLAYLGLQTTLKMIFLYDFVHGDLHPGNILVSGKYPKLRLNLLDCGLVVEMGPEQHRNVVKVLGAFTRKDGRLAGQLMVDMNSESQASPHDVELFVSGIEQICVMDSDQNFIEKVGDYIADICYMACRHRVKLEPSFVNCSLAVEIMEGLASALCPDMRVQPVALPLVFKAEMMHRLGLH